ncbi:LysM peptidoglycan-binding domain-containing protein [Sphingomonas jatrophae]|uniref:LysM domain-containing protein n=1 Tax=Sphingomonas jatrophae TaxID=1166337 RepID=A0A1I6KZ38_9SPHN|nr:LysM peptidoglycan-binding domain-containing protein [Sphingomonas jatrophae]SFR96513.1 LysM domain-containing protein [Sphingomonas jatrophae]
MIRHLYRRRNAAAVALLLALSACGGGPLSVGDKAPPAKDSWKGREDVGRAIELLNKGETDRARSVLTKVLKRQPNDPIATGLLAQIDRDPVALLGRESFAYAVKPNETLADLAGRFLGNPTSFYALGRYNGLSFPVSLSPGQVLRIPGEAKVARPRPAADKPRAARPAKPTINAEPARPAAAPPTADPARATRLRAAALEQLNRGQVNRAVSLLRQADQASPGNPLVRRDLERAERIQRTLKP